MESPSPSAAAAAWFTTDLEELDDFNFILECPLSPMFEEIVVEEINISADLGEDLQQSFSSENESSTPCPAMNSNESAHIAVSPIVTDFHNDEFTGSERPVKVKQVKASGSNSSSHTSHNSSLIHHVPLSSKSQFLLSFENPNSSPTGSANKNQIRDCLGNGIGVVKPKQSWSTHFTSPSPKDSSDAEHYASKTSKAGTKRSHSATRSPSHARDHIMAERMRREKLTQLFIALSALVPGLKKVDKASVLEDAIKYVKQLQERVNVLENQTKKRTVESAVLVMKHNPSVSGVDDDDTSSCEETSQTQSHARFTDDSLAEVEARISDKQVLIRVRCQRQIGVVNRILNVLESFHLSILSTSALPFGDLILQITIIAKMESEFSIAVKDLVKSLHLAL